MQLDVHDGSIENGLEEPAFVDAIVKEAADRAVAERRIPLVAIPCRRLRIPPRARSSPRTRGTVDVASRHTPAIDGNMDGTAAINRDADSHRRAEAAQNQVTRCSLLAARSWRLAPGGWLLA